jgi:L-malate glycosyltransferase
MQLVLSLSPGGTERLVIEIVKSLSAQVESSVCCLDAPGAWASQLTDRGVPVTSLSRTPGFQPGLAVRLAKLMRSQAIDVVHCHHYSPYVYGLLATLLAPGVQLVFTEHGKLSDAGPSRKRRLINPLLSRLPGRLFAVSADLRQHMISEGFPARCVDVIYNGIDPGERPTTAERQAGRADLGVPGDAFVIGAVGRLDPVKNLRLLLQAHTLLLTKMPHARTVIIGDGAERERLEALAAELGVGDSVVFAGYRPHVRALMSAFDVYVNCSTYEGASLTILEAMAAGLPVVATPVGGNPELVIDRETGWLTPGRAAAMTEALTALALDAKLRRLMGDAGRWRVTRHFSMQRMVDQYASAYLGSRKPMANPPASEPAPAERMSVSEATRSIV